MQLTSRAHGDAAAGRLQPHHIERRASGDAQSAALADGEMDDALMLPDGAAVEVDDIARLKRIRPQAADDLGIAPGRDEADVLTVLLVSDRQAEAPRQFAGLLL